MSIKPEPGDIWRLNLGSIKKPLLPFKFFVMGLKGSGYKTKYVVHGISKNEDGIVTINDFWFWPDDSFWLEKLK